MGPELVNEAQIKRWNYPGGEVGVRILPGTPASITWRIQNSNDMIALAMASNARPEGPFEEVFIPYFPYGRQDRRAVVGDPDAIHVVARLLKSSGISHIVTLDPHSLGTLRILREVGINAMAISPTKLLEKYIRQIAQERDIVLINPDAGAESKTFHYAAYLGNRVSGIMRCAKKRDPKTGELCGFELVNFTGRGCQADTPHVIVDDICDGGRTFFGVKDAFLPERLRATFKGTVHLWTTHAIYSAGIDKLITEFDSIGSTNSFKHGFAHDKLITIPLEENL